MKGPALELVVLEGGGKHSRFLLNQVHYWLGRMDPGEPKDDGKLQFPEPTVSKVHAELVWDESKNRYLLIHRSQTNATLVNGARVTKARHINPGDRIAMGRLTLEIRIGIGQHSQAEIADVDVAALTREAAATAPEIVTWVAHTPVSSPAPPAPVPSRIPPPARKPRPLPAFEYPYNPVPVDPAALAPPPEWETPALVEAEEEPVAADLSPRRIVLQPEVALEEVVPEVALEEVVPEVAVEEVVPEVAVEEEAVEKVAPPSKPKPYVRPGRKIGRNEPCPCGSGKKFKKCCLS